MHTLRTLESASISMCSIIWTYDPYASIVKHVDIQQQRRLPTDRITL